MPPPPPRIPAWRTCGGTVRHNTALHWTADAAGELTGCYCSFIQRPSTSLYCGVTSYTGRMHRGGVIMVHVLQDKHQAIAKLCARFGVVRLDVFGSTLRDDFRPGESDLDLLVVFGPMEPFALADAYFGLLGELRDLLGVKVDLVDRKSVV